MRGLTEGYTHRADPRGADCSAGCGTAAWGKEGLNLVCGDSERVDGTGCGLVPSAFAAHVAQAGKDQGFNVLAKRKPKL